jgi:hypothetical protein
MEKGLLQKSMQVWLALAALAIVNGILRNAVYRPVVGDLLAHHLSSVIFMTVILIVTYLFLRNTPPIPEEESWNVGAVWVIATVAFEFIFGHYVFGNSWAKLFADYNLFAGRIWSLVLLAMLSAPYVVGVYLAKRKKVF